MNGKYVSETVFTSLLIFLMFQLGCQTKEKFYREKELLHFLESNKISTLPGNTILLLLVGSSCETCLEATKEILILRNEIQPEYTIVILGDELARREYTQYIQDNHNTMLILTNADTLASKGLLLQGDGIFFISENKKIRKLWSITYQNQSRISRELNKRKYLCCDMSNDNEDRDED